MKHRLRFSSSTVSESVGVSQGREVTFLTSFQEMVLLIWEHFENHRSRLNRFSVYWLYITNFPGMLLEHSEILIFNQSLVGLRDQ